jgi:hypothetical protein
MTSDQLDAYAERLAHQATELPALTMRQACCCRP